MTDTTASRPPYDPELQEFLVTLPDAEAVLPAGTPSVAEVVAAMRKTTEDYPSIESILAGTPITRTDLTVPGLAGDPDVLLSVFRHPDTPADAPCFLHIHGGGMVMGDRFSGAHLFAHWAQAFSAVVVSVEYRLAPDHPAPAAVHDCYAALAWLSANAGSLDIDPERIVVVGVSGGGGLAAGMALLARDRGGPRLLGQVLMAPMLDDRVQSPSTEQHRDAPMWTRALNVLAWTAVLGDRRGAPDVSPYMAPARADALAGLPPTYIDVGSAEIFRDEVVDFATRLLRAGNLCELHIWAGGFHAFEMASHTRIAKAAAAARNNWLQRLLG